MRLRAVIVALAVVVLAGGGEARAAVGGGVSVFIGVTTIPAVGDVANLWVDDGTCSTTPTRGAPSMTFAAASASGAVACTLDQAQDAANGGDTVRIKNGTYPTQDITGSKASTVTYIGESKAGVIFTAEVGLETNVALEDVTVSNDSHNFEAFNFDGTTDVVLRNVDALGDYMSQYVQGVTRFSWIGGSFGDFDGSIQERHCGDPGSAEAPDGDKEPLWIGENSVGPILIEGIHFSEMDAENTNGQSGCLPTDNFHLEVWRVDDGVDNVTFRRNIVDPCPGCNTAIVFISNNGDGQPENLSFVGNMFGAGKVFKMESAPCVNYLFAYNSIASTWSSISCSTYTNMRWVGNVVRHEWVADDGGSSCNIGNPCVDNLGFTSATDLHLTGSSPALDSGETTGASDICTDASIMGTLGDIDGDPRGVGGTCDAGADEVG
jgi:hypothetical protein